MLYDKNIREPLFDWLELQFGKSRIFEEKVMGKSRADVILILPQEIIGIEIKSNADTYARLKKQVRSYNQFCDRNYIVTGLRHLKHVGDHIPSSWGILCIYEDKGHIQIEIHREATLNPLCKPKSQFSWAWKEELFHILALHSMPKYRQKSKAFIVDKLLEKVPLSVLKTEFCQELFERDYTIYNEEELP